MTGWARSIPAGTALAALLVATLLAACAAPVGPASAETSRGPFVRVLGAAQDGGFPHAACEHDACRQARSREAAPRYVSSLALVLPATDQVFLFDATPDIRPQLDLLRDVRRPPQDRVDRAPLDGVFLTHAHIGHYLGLAFLGFEAISASDLPVWVTPRMAAFLRANGPWSQLVDMGNIDLKPTSPGETVALSPEVSVTAFTVPHRDEFSDTVAYVIRGPRRSLLFVPDTDRWATWDPPLLERLAEVDVALLDSTFYSLDELPGRSLEEVPHPMTRTTMDLLEEHVGPDLEVVFIHLNHSNPALLPDSPERGEVEARGFAVALEGQEFDL